MQIINQSATILNYDSNALQQIEQAGRTCYQSQDKITESSAEKFVSRLQKKKHLAMLEFADIAVKFITNRGVSHELVRHRLASFSQESTRYVTSTKNNTIQSVDDIYVAYSKGWPISQIAKYSNKLFTEAQIYKITEKKNKKHFKLKCHINSKRLNKIDSADKAFFAGLFITLGQLWLDKNKKKVIISFLQNQFGLNSFLKTFLKISSLDLRNHQSQYVIESDSLFNALSEFGFITGASIRMLRKEVKALWTSIPTEFEADFIRGLLEGSGTIKFWEDQDIKNCQIAFINNKHILTKINSWLFKEFGYKTTIVACSKSLNYQSVITDLKVGKIVCAKLYNNFIFPFGHLKAISALSQIDLDPPLATFGDENFKIIRPIWFNSGHVSTWLWIKSMIESESTYTDLRQLGWSPQQAREVLTNSLKTELCMKANVREWLHILDLRCSKAAHPQMRALMIDTLHQFQKLFPTVFNELFY